jgi:hypothetical protein
MSSTGPETLDVNGLWLQAARLSGLASSLGRSRVFNFQKVHGQHISQKPELIVETHDFITEVCFRRRHHEGIKTIVFDQALTVFAKDDML